MPMRTTAALRCLLTSLCVTVCMAEAGELVTAPHSGATPPASLVAISTAGAVVHWEREVKPILDRRCVVCHSCYDAPCQLQLSSFEGADRGATKAVVYQGDRLAPMDPTRLFIDAKTTAEWRDRDFYSVLHASGEHAAAASLMQRMLDLGRVNPLPANQKIPASVDLTPYRALSCPRDAEFAVYAEAHPLGGMPYGLAPLAETEYQTLVSWLRDGAPVPMARARPPETAAGSVAKWEAFFNGDSAKERVTSRYIYEHLFLAHIHFPDVAPGRYFRLVRSRTPSGREIDEIPTTRPYDPPGVERFYYRLQWIHSTIVDKTHMVYPLTDARLARYRELFLAPAWQSEVVPSYDPEKSANAFVAFENVPPRARYQFLLDDAHYFINTFIKGPVCRGQVALNVIDDHFFVAFMSPNADLSVTDPSYLSESKEWLKLPAENKNRLTPGDIWLKYLVEWRKYLRYRSARYRERDPRRLGPSLDDIWDGDGTNDNALLTVFRHFDSATVVKGYVGEIPKTAWIIDYPILERVYYDLVAGFDVFGNVVHQLSTRLYMDYLRMESEDLFISFLPADVRESTRDSWYVGAGAQTKAFLENRLSNLDVGTRVAYRTSSPKTELIESILARASPAVRGVPDPINRCMAAPCTRADAPPHAHAVEGELRKLASVARPFVQHMPDLSLLRVRIDSTGTRDLVYSLVHNKAHFNVAFMFDENERRNPSADTMTIVPGYLGSYPNFFFDVTGGEVPNLVARLTAVTSDADFAKLAEAYGIRRSSPRFWELADWFHAERVRSVPIEAGRLDLNRYGDY